MSGSILLLQPVLLGNQLEGFFVVFRIDLDFDGLGEVEAGVGGGGAEDGGGDAVVPQHTGENFGGDGLVEFRDGLEFLGVNRFHDL